MNIDERIEALAAQFGFDLEDEDDAMTAAAWAHDDARDAAIYEWVRYRFDPVLADYIAQELIDMVEGSASAVAERAFTQTIGGAA